MISTDPWVRHLSLSLPESLEDQMVATVTKRNMNVGDLTLFTVSAIILLDTLAATASIGVSSISWWVVLGVLFMVPLGLITAELGAAYPQEGGMYVWIRRAFGARWGGRAAWAYWINTAIWIPSLHILFAGFLVRIFGLDLEIREQVVIGIALTWGTVLVDIVGLKVGKWIPNIGALIKFTIFSLIIGGGLLYARQYGFANEVSVASLTPQWNEGIKYLPAIIYGMLGFELVSSAGDNIKNPHHSVPIGILLSGLIVLSLYTLATVGILAAIPAVDIDIVHGLVDTLELFLGGVPGGEVLVIVVSLAVTFTFFSNGVTWAIGCNRSTAQAASEGTFPKIFALRHQQHDGPVGAAVMMGIISTAVLVVYGAQAFTNADLFWDLLAFSAVIFMMPYIGLVMAFLQLRRVDAEAPRPFLVLGGLPVAIFFTAICTIVIALAILLFLYVPGDGVQWPIVFGVMTAVCLGEVAMWVAPGTDRVEK
ncbi:MAG: APC family permease [Pseudomonadota bacterium]